VWVEDAAEGARRASPSSPGPRFRLVLDDRESSCSTERTVIGRTSESPLWIDDASVSRPHAQVRRHGRRARLEDLEARTAIVPERPQDLARRCRSRTATRSASESVEIYFRTL
jgi:pSer/pThr/pTyr-binding forkhead associated (FHA) protein